MRILHTADWHFGKTLEGRDRLAEQADFIDELCAICDQESVDLILMAGDVFQTPNPSAAAEELFYHAIDRLSNSGRRGMVIIAGNHDNPDRLIASAPLATRNGIALIGRPHDTIQPTTHTLTDRVSVIQSGASWLEIRIPDCDHHAVIAALPYPSEARLRELLTQSTEDSELQKEYNDKIKHIFEQLESHYRTDTVNLAMSHLYVHGGTMSDSEHQIQVGGSYSVDPNVFPTTAQYVALGHLHRPQSVPASVPTRYSGSPLAYSFSEAGQQKSVVLIDVVPNEPATIRQISLTAGKPLAQWFVMEGLQQLEAWVEEGKDCEAWIDLSIHVSSPLSMEDIQTIRRLHPGVVNVRQILPEMDQRKTIEELRDLSIEQLFVRFYQQQTSGGMPDQDVVRLFLEMTLDDGADSEELLTQEREEGIAG